MSGERLGDMPLLGYKSSMAGLAPQSTQGEGGTGGQGQGALAARPLLALQAASVHEGTSC